MFTSIYKIIKCNKYLLNNKHRIHNAKHDLITYSIGFIEFCHSFQIYKITFMPFTTFQKL